MRTVAPHLAVTLGHDHRSAVLVQFEIGNARNANVHTYINICIH